MLAPNTVLQGRYCIIRLINQGNMGAVYLAEDTRLGNEVALKETFSAGGDAELREQFHREARLLSNLRHPSLPRVIDHFIDGSGQFLAMDYIDGEDLQESLRRNGGPFPIDRVLGWADQLLDVLTYLHTQDEPVIHRDIKPANIKLTPKGKLFLLDFGLAKGSTASMLKSLPAATPAYAPLEQVTYQGTDARSDLYALAATLYQLMTGALPPTALQRRDARWQGQPDPLVPASLRNPQVSDAISQVLTQAMSLQAKDRPARADAMRQMLIAAKGNDQPTVIASAAPEITTTAPMASESRRESDPSLIDQPSSIAVNLPIQKEQADQLGATERLQNPSTQPAVPPPSPLAIEAASFPQSARKWKPLLLQLLFIGMLLIVTIVVFSLKDRIKPDTTNNSQGTTGTTTQPPSQPTNPEMKSFVFDVATVNAEGDITNERKGQARQFAEDLGGGVTLYMVEIPEGKFEMGSSDAFAAIVRRENKRINSNIALEAKLWSDRETKQHTVTVPTFYMGRFEVTQAQWLAVVKNFPRVRLGLPESLPDFKGENFPVEMVSREEAMEFCARLSQAKGREYRLPSEAEWEYACRAGTTTPFSFGESINPEIANFDGGHPFGLAKPGINRRGTTEVGSFTYANGYGLSDMHGNVWEWCLDSWHESYNNEAPSDGSAWRAKGEMGYCAMRGGSWDYIANFCRSASRLKVPVTTRDNRYGFRVVAVARTP